MKSTLCLFLVLLAGAGTLIAGTTGKISGHVADAGSGESLVGANIVLVGAPLGASTGTDGSYVILNIPPGTYDLRVTLVGYGPTLIKGIRIVADERQHSPQTQRTCPTDQCIDRIAAPLQATIRNHIIQLSITTR